MVCEYQMAVDSAAFRAVMGRFATGVTVVTTCDGPRRYGITVNAFCSVSLDPPLVLICIDHTSRVHDILAHAGFFAVNFLRSDQAHLSTCFATTTEERYANFCHAKSHPVATGAPVLDDSLGYADCRIVTCYPGGDHTIFLGQVEALAVGDGEPLLYYHSRYLNARDESDT
jgi:flavin reductase (DIM6/NTAB) family NADH-FMN oxidoreductase RutF